MRAVTHIHTCHSWDSRMSPRALADRLVGAGIEVAMVTDHDSFGGALELRALVRENGLALRVPVAAEIRTELGDVIVVFEDGTPPPIESLKTWDRLRDTVRDLGGLIWLPHPYRSHDRVEELAEASDVVEVFNSRCGPEANSRAADLCKRHGRVRGFGSDAHLLREAGTWSVEYAGDGPLLDLLVAPSTCADPLPARPSDVSVAEVINGLKRRRPTLVGYYGLRYARDRARELTKAVR